MNLKLQKQCIYLKILQCHQKINIWTCTKKNDRTTPYIAMFQATSVNLSNIKCKNVPIFILIVSWSVYRCLCVNT